jgi:hypothetical protein
LKSGWSRNRLLGKTGSVSAAFSKPVGGPSKVEARAIGR